MLAFSSTILFIFSLFFTPLMATFDANFSVKSKFDPPFDRRLRYSNQQGKSEVLRVFTNAEEMKSKLVILSQEVFNFLAPICFFYFSFPLNIFNNLELWHDEDWKYRKYRNWRNNMSSILFIRSIWTHFAFKLWSEWLEQIELFISSCQFCIVMQCTFSILNRFISQPAC